MLPHFPPIFSRAHQLSLSPALFEEEDEDEDSAERKLHVNVALQVVLPAPPPSQQCLRRFRVKSRLGSRKSDFKQSDRAAAACAGSPEKDEPENAPQTVSPHGTWLGATGAAGQERTGPPQNVRWALAGWLRRWTAVWLFAI